MYTSALEHSILTEHWILKRRPSNFNWVLDTQEASITSIASRPFFYLPSPFILNVNFFISYSNAGVSSKVKRGKISLTQYKRATPLILMRCICRSWVDRPQEETLSYSLGVAKLRENLQRNLSTCCQIQSSPQEKEIERSRFRSIIFFICCQFLREQVFSPYCTLSVWY